MTSASVSQLLSAKYRPYGIAVAGGGGTGNGNRTAAGKPWRHSAPETLQDFTGLSFSAQFMQHVRDATRATPATPSMAVTCSSEDEDEDELGEDESLDESAMLDQDEGPDEAAELDEEEEMEGLQDLDEDSESGSDGQTSAACGSDCCPSDVEDWSEEEEDEEEDVRDDFDGLIGFD